MDLDNDLDTTERLPFDAAGNWRFLDDPATIDTGVADPPLYVDVVDMGAYEFGACSQDVHCSDGDLCNGEETCGTGGLCVGVIFSDCNGNSLHDPCDVEMGTSPDCNENGVPDECDLADESSLDDNGDDIPDECQTGACCDADPGVCTPGVNAWQCPTDGPLVAWFEGQTCSQIDCQQALGACGYETAGLCMESVPFAACAGTWFHNTPCAEVDYEKVIVPTISTLGLALLGLLLAAGIAIHARRRASVERS